MFDFLKRPTHFAVLNTLTAYEEENKSLREEVHRLSRKESELLCVNYELKRRLERIERLGAGCSLSPTTTPREFAELLKFSFEKIIANYTRSFKAYLRLEVYDLVTDSPVEFEMEMEL